MISKDVQKIIEIYTSKIRDYLKGKTISLEDRKEIGKEMYRLVFKNIEEPAQKEVTPTDKKSVPIIQPSLLNYQHKMLNEAFKNIPIGVTVDVNEELLPYLVSASSAKREVVWVQSHDKGLICLGVLNREEIKEEVIFNRVIQEVIDSEEIYFRGNIFLFDLADKKSIEDAVKSAIKYLEYFDIASTRVIHNIEDFTFEGAVKADWMTPNRICVVPEDLSYLGDIFLIGRKHYAINVHNINRGISVCIAHEKTEE